MDILKYIPIFVLVAIIVAGLWPHPLKASIANNIPIPIDHTELTGIRNGNDLPMRSIEITPSSTAPFIIDIDRRGEPSLRPGSFGSSTGSKIKGSATSGLLSAPQIKTYRTENEPPIDICDDIGAWASVRLSPVKRPIDIGIRYSPIRLAWDVVAPDALLSPNAIGIGVSLYLPNRIAKAPWSDIGIGGAWLTDFDGGHGFTPYISLSHRF